MATVEQNEAAARRCIDLYNQGNSDWVDICYSPNAQWIEHPHLGNPHGHSGGRDALRRLSEFQISFFPDRHMTVTDMVAQGNVVVLEQDWQGTAAKPFGDTPVGTVEKSRIATFLTFDENAMIVKHEDYVASVL
ncbi:MAG: nuclear transport factor 2 family protein [Anaerolineaceae bacterium]